MKVTRMFYNDNDVLIPGVLIQRIFRKPVFFSMDSRCGWDRRSITKSEKKNLMVSPFLFDRGSSKSFIAHIKLCDVTITQLESQIEQLKQLRDEYLREKNTIKKGKTV